MSGMNEKYRLQSLDIFRGITIAAMILVNTPGNGDNVYPALEHSKWNGCTPTDLVFPSFLFMVGISIVYALKNKRADPSTHVKVLLGSFRRMLLIIGIGLAIQLFYKFDFHTLRYPGVLQRIGVVYFISTVLYLKLGNRALGWIFSLALLSYYFIMVFVPAPNGQLTNLEPDTNLAAYIDRAVFTLPHMKKDTKYWDPLGLLSTLPAVSSTLFGIGIGLLLNKPGTESERKTILMFLTGIIAIVAGQCWDLFFPINKPLWSSSYVLYAGGICTLGFTVTYWWVDLERRGNGLWPFLVFGRNAISAYVLSEILPSVFNYLHLNRNGQSISGMDFFYSQVFLPFMSPKNASLLGACVFVAVIWLLMYPLYRKNILIKI